jgi:hypothetical protein
MMAILLDEKLWKPASRHWPVAIGAAPDVGQGPTGQKHYNRSHDYQRAFTEYRQRKRNGNEEEDAKKYGEKVIFRLNTHFAPHNSISYCRAPSRSSKGLRPQSSLLIPPLLLPWREKSRSVAEGMRGLQQPGAPAETAPSSTPPSAGPLLPQGEKKSFVVHPSIRWHHVFGATY